MTQRLCGGWLALSEGVTYYEDSGPAENPPVVLVHGFSVPSFVWDRTWPALVRAGWRVIRFDLYGRGASGKPSGPYQLGRFTRQVWEVLDHLAPATPVSLVGYSMGGPIVAAAAVARPAVVQRVLLIAPVVTGVALGRLWRVLALPGLGPWLMRTVARSRMEQGVRADFHTAADETYVRRYSAQWHDPGFARALASSVRHGMLGDFRGLFAALNRTGLPVAALWGRDDALVPVTQLDALRAQVPSLQAHIVPDAGHLVHYERAAEVNAWLLQNLTASDPNRGPTD